jgi:hypothetical protein
MSFCGFVALAAAFSIQPVESQSGASRPAVLYDGARLISGTGDVPIEQSAFLVERGTITKIGKKGECTAPAGAARVDTSPA